MELGLSILPEEGPPHANMAVFLTILACRDIIPRGSTPSIVRWLVRLIKKSDA